MPPPDARPAIKSMRAASSNITSDPHYREPQDFDSVARPGMNRANTFQGPTQLNRDISPIGTQRMLNRDISPVGAQGMTRVPSDNLTVRTQRAQLRPLARVNPENDLFSHPSDDSTFTSSPDRSYRERSASPATSQGSAMSRNVSSSTLDLAANGRKQPPPPPPSRAKKPPPPPPPMKRSALSTTNVSYA